MKLRSHRDGTENFTSLKGPRNITPDKVLLFKCQFSGLAVMKSILTRAEHRDSTQPIGRLPRQAEGGQNRCGLCLHQPAPTQAAVHGPAFLGNSVSQRERETVGPGLSPPPARSQKAKWLALLSGCQNPWRPSGTAKGSSCSSVLSALRGG